MARAQQLLSTITPERFDTLLNKLKIKGVNKTTKEERVEIMEEMRDIYKPVYKIIAQPK